MIYWQLECMLAALSSILLPRIRHFSKCLIQQSKILRSTSRTRESMAYSFLSHSQVILLIVAEIEGYTYQFIASRITLLDSFSRLLLVSEPLSRFATPEPLLLWSFRKHSCHIKTPLANYNRVTDYFLEEVPQ